MSSSIPIDTTTFVRNPYIIGVPIIKRENFFGREELFQFLTSVLNEGSKVILLHGQRRIGKTSVLRQIPNFVSLDNLAFVTFDLQDQTRLPLSRVLLNLATAIVEQISGSLEIPLNIPTPQSFEEDPYVFTQSFLPDIFAALKGKKLVLLLDEFDVLNTYKEDAAVEHFFPFLQSIINRQPHLHIIAVVGRRLDEIPLLLSLFKGAPNHEIGLLDRRGAQRLILKPSQGVLEYDAAAIHALLDLSQCHPYFTQLLCHVTFASVREVNRCTVHRADVEEIVERAIVSGEAGLVWFREGLPIPERVIFSAIAEAQEISSVSLTIADRLIGPGITRSTLSTFLDQRGIVLTERLRLAEQRLIEWGFVKAVGDIDVANPEAQPYRVTIELVRRWLLRRHPLKLAMRELEKENPNAERLYQEALNQLETGVLQGAFADLRKVLEQNPNHVRAILDLARLSLELADFDKAVEFYQRGFKIDPLRCKDGLVRALSESVNDLLAAGRFDTALERLERAHALEPSDLSIVKQLEDTKERHRQSLAIYDPFIVGNVVPPDQFVGREKEIDTIFSRILRGGHVAICGERRIGKTSLVRYLTSTEVWQKRNFPVNERVVIGVDCSSIIPFSPDRFRLEVLLELREQTADTIDLAGSINDLRDASNLTVRDLRRLLTDLGKRNLSLVLLIDEFDVALQPHETYSEEDVAAFLYEMRSLAHSREGQYFSSVIALRRKPSDFTMTSGVTGGGSSPIPSISSSGSPWYNHYSLIPLKLFEEPDVQSLMARMPDAFALSSEETEWVRRLGGGHPYLLQAELSTVFRLHADKRAFEIEQTTREILSLAESLFLTLWSGASDLERMLLTAIALHDYQRHMSPESKFLGYGAVFESSERELRELEQRSILVRRPYQDSYRYAVFSPLMSWWIIKEIEARSDDEIVQLTDTFTNYFNPALASQLLNLLLEVRQKKAAYGALSSWIS